MRTVKLSSLWRDLARDLGMPPELVDDYTKAALAGALDSALLNAWEHGLWPEWCPVLNYTPVAEWSAEATYVTDAVVWYSVDGLYYKALVDVAAGGDAPPDDAVSWELTATPVTPDFRTVINVYLSDPRDNPRALRTKFITGAEGVSLPCADGITPVWVHYRPTAPKLTLTAWDDAKYYEVGAVVYRENANEDGDSYRALLAGTNKDPLTEPAYWAVQSVPQIIAEAVKLAAQATRLAALGRQDTASVVRDNAQTELAQAYLKAVGQTRALRW